MTIKYFNSGLYIEPFYTRYEIDLLTDNTVYDNIEYNATPTTFKKEAE